MANRISLDDHGDMWNRAVERALDNGCESKVHHVYTEHDTALGWESLFAVKSASTEGRRYLVQLVVEDGERTASCNCPAGQNGVICWHATGAALAAGMLTQTPPDDDTAGAPPDSAADADAVFDLSAVLNGDYRAALMSGQLG